MLKLASLTTGASYTKAASALNAAFGTVKALSEGSLKNAGSEPIRVSVTQGGATTGVDAVSKLLAAGEVLPFGELDLNNLWYKSPTGASTLEINGDV